MGAMKRLESMKFQCLNYISSGNSSVIFHQENLLHSLTSLLLLVLDCRKKNDCTRRTNWPKMRTLFQCTILLNDRRFIDRRRDTILSFCQRRNSFGCCFFCAAKYASNRKPEIQMSQPSVSAGIVRLPFPCCPRNIWQTSI